MTRPTPDSGYVRETAERSLTGAQRVVLTLLLVAAAGVGIWSALLLAVLLVACSMVFLLCFIGLKLALFWGAHRHQYPERVDVADDDLPPYTTLHPLYDEANMIPLVVAAMEAMDYPKDRLQCLLVLESRDAATVQAARDFPLPDYFEVVEVPAVEPYGKPKACNYALQFATGDYVVIYDAEDKPEPDQLRKVVGTFVLAQERDEPLGCLQARLRFENELALRDSDGRVVRDDDGYDVRPVSWTSRFLGNEYITHFELVLTGMSYLDLAIPLGGTSNHFPVAVLREVAFPSEVMPQMPDGDASVGAWDPWNVTEDAELGGAIAAAGYRTRMVDSFTDEEACLTARAALNQRSRWLKGYLQTTLVLLRRPFAAMRALGPRRYAGFVLQVGGTYLSLMLSPIFWGLFIAYAFTGSPRIIALFPGALYYTGMVLLIVGNLSLLTVSFYAAHSRAHHSTVRYLALLTPAWWALLSAATYVATLELLFPRWRPAWNKTAHGVRHVGWGRRLAVSVFGPTGPEWPRPTPSAVPAAAARELTPAVQRRRTTLTSRPVPGLIAAADVPAAPTLRARPRRGKPPVRVVERPAIRFLSVPDTARYDVTEAARPAARRPIATRPAPARTSLVRSLWNGSPPVRVVDRPAIGYLKQPVSAARG